MVNLSASCFDDIHDAAIGTRSCCVSIPFNCVTLRVGNVDYELESIWRPFDEDKYQITSFVDG